MTSVIAAGSVSTAMSPSSTSTASTFFAITPLISSTDPGLRAAMVALLPAKRKRSPFVLIPVSAPSPSFRSIVVTAGAYVSPVTLPVAFAPSELFALLALPLDEPLLPHANITSVADHCHTRGELISSESFFQLPSVAEIAIRRTERPKA